MTYCTASEENIGKGRCNHVAHQVYNESTQSFLERTSQSFPQSKNTVNFDTWEYLNMNFPQQTKKAYEDFLQYSHCVSLQQYKIALWKEMIFDQESRMEYQNKVESLDRQRRILHDQSMESVKSLNKYASLLHVDPFLDIPITHENRTDIADALFNLVTQ